VTNSEFTKALGKALKRPTVLPMPGFMVKILMGQMGKELLLAGKRVVPAKALSAGYRFKFDTVDEAMSDLFG
jgi:NAD dependent epimerase/dehydratase family enzyme